MFELSEVCGGARRRGGLPAARRYNNGKLSAMARALWRRIDAACSGHDIAPQSRPAGMPDEAGEVTDS